jgi:hypothetical protein
MFLLTVIVIVVVLSLALWSLLTEPRSSSMSMNNTVVL